MKRNLPEEEIDLRAEGARARLDEAEVRVEEGVRQAKDEVTREDAVKVGEDPRRVETPVAMITGIKLPVDRIDQIIAGRIGRDKLITCEWILRLQ